jgi:hypothetical protein
VSTYRDPRLSSRLRFEELLEDVERERPLRESAIRIGARRLARVAFGVVALGGAALVVEAAIAGRGTDRSGALSELLLASWATAIVAWLLARAIAPLVVRRVLACPALTGDVELDVARLEGRPLLPSPTRWAWVGAALPMAGVSLLAPLTLHLAFWAFFVRSTADMLGDFDPWIVYGLALVGQAHVVLALYACRQAQRLVEAPLTTVDQVGGAWRALGVTVFASAFPGVVIFSVPPLLTAVTGALFVPALFSAMKRVVVVERRELAAVGLV